MQKWTMSGRRTTVSLRGILDGRGYKLNEVESWAMLEQSVLAIQDLLASLSQKSTSTTSLMLLMKKYSQNTITVTPKRILCNVAGKVVLKDELSSVTEENADSEEREFRHPSISLRKGTTSSVSASASRTCPLWTVNLQRDMEIMSVFSLGKTVLSCTQMEKSSDSLRNILNRMTSRDTISLADLVKSIQISWRAMFGSTPSSKFVAQMAKLTLGWNVHQSCSAISNPPQKRILNGTGSKSSLLLDKCIASGQQIELSSLGSSGGTAPLAEVEFSRLSSMSDDDDDVDQVEEMDTQDKETLGSDDEMDHHNNNNHHEIGNPQSKPQLKEGIQDEDDEGDVYENVEVNLSDQLVGPQQQQHEDSSSLSRKRPESSSTIVRAASASSGGSTKRFCPSSSSASHSERVSTLSSFPRTVRKSKVCRNPSRLYRIVRPLAEVSPTPSPATKRCIGPEFVVMAAASENNPEIIDLTCRHFGQSNASTPAKIEIVMLDGQKIEVRCSPHSITAGEVFENVLSHQDMKESNYYALAVKDQSMDEYWILSPDTKLYKVAPTGWKMTSQGSLKLYFRFKIQPESTDEFKDSRNMHQLYLQLRRDVLDGRFRMNLQNNLSLAAMALQTEFGDFSEDIHGSDGEYFILSHYVPQHVISQLGESDARRFLTKMHRSLVGQSQSKTEMRYCKDVQGHDNYGFQTFSVRETKKPSSLPKRHLGIHLKGLFLFETSKDPTKAHKIIAAFNWNNITKIQYDKCRFQISVSDKETSSAKVKFYVDEVKSKLMFDLASTHHQTYVQHLWNEHRQLKEAEMDQISVEYREPLSRDKTMRTLKNKFLSRRQLSQRKMSVNTVTRVASMSLQDPTNVKKRVRSASANRILVRRLAHYSSMADAVSKSDQKQTADDSGCSDKENCSPNIVHTTPYRYKVYLEPDEDCMSLPPMTPHPASTTSTARAPLQERPLHHALPSSSPPPRPPKPAALTSQKPTAMMMTPSTTETKRPRTVMTTSVPRKTPCGRKSIGASAAAATPGTSRDNNARSLRMGTRISMSALHRERLRLVTGLETTPMVFNDPPRKRALDLDYGTMEFKSILSNDPVPEPKFVDMPQHADNSEPVYERRVIVSATVFKDSQGRFGLKVTGTPNGIFVDGIDERVARVEGDLQPGDRIIAINGRSIENVSYQGALDLMRRSSHEVQLLVSQIKH